MNTRRQQLSLLANGFRQVRASSLIKVWISADDAELLAWAVEEFLRIGRSEPSLHTEVLPGHTYTDAQVLSQERDDALREHARAEGYAAALKDAVAMSPAESTNSQKEPT